MWVRFCKCLWKRVRSTSWIPKWSASYYMVRCLQHLCALTPLQCLQNDSIWCWEWGVDDAVVLFAFADTMSMFHCRTLQGPQRFSPKLLNHGIHPLRQSTKCARCCFIANTNSTSFKDQPMVTLAAQAIDAGGISKCGSCSLKNSTRSSMYMVSVLAVFASSRFSPVKGTPFIAIAQLNSIKESLSYISNRILGISNTTVT